MRRNNQSSNANEQLRKCFTLSRLCLFLSKCNLNKNEQVKGATKRSSAQIVSKNRTMHSLAGVAIV